MKAPLVVRVNGVVVRRVKVREYVWDGKPTGEQELIIFDPVIGSFPVDESFVFEVRYLTAPESACPSGNNDWQQVTLQELLELLTAAHADQQQQCSSGTEGIDTPPPPPPDGDPNED